MEKNKKNQIAKKEETLTQLVQSADFISATPETIGNKFNEVAKMHQKGELVEIEETAGYFDPEMNVPYLCLIEEMTTMETTDNEGEIKSMPAVFFHARKMDKNGPAERVLSASKIIVKTLERILEKTGPYGAFVKITFTGQVGKGTDKYNNFDIQILKSK